MVESPLKYATSSISCFGKGTGYAVGSIEGRCGIVNVNLNSVDTVDNNDFCFKCHRQEESSKNEAVLHTVNAITFNKEHNTLATAGSDGQLVIWNKDTKSRYKSTAKAPLPITASCFSDDASILVFA